MDAGCFLEIRTPVSGTQALFTVQLLVNAGLSLLLPASAGRVLIRRRVIQERQKGKY